MKVKNMTNSNGNKVIDQFIIKGMSTGQFFDGIKHASGSMFQSYDFSIAFKDFTGKVYLDKSKWDYSNTTGKYRNIFLEEDKRTTQKKINSGEYILTDLN